MKRIVAVLFFVLLSAPPVWADCGPKLKTIAGTLQEVRTRHPNGTPILAYQIRSSSAIEAEGILSDGCVTARLIHIVPRNKADGRWLSKHLGQVVTVTSDDVFEAHTAWHQGEAVAQDVKIAQ